MKKSEIQELQNNASKEQVGRVIPTIAQHVLKELESRKEVDFSKVSIDGLPGSFNVVVSASGAAMDAYVDYDSKADGDLTDYLAWIIESVIRMMSAEFKTGKVKENYVIYSLNNFFKKISLTLEKTKDCDKAAELLDIPANEKMIKKVATICDERIL